MSEKNSVKKSTITQQKYDSKNSVHISMKLNVSTDAAILTKLSSVPSMSGYIRSVILDDIRRNDPDLLKITRFEKEDGRISLGRTSPSPADTLILPTSNSPSNPEKNKREKEE